MGTLLHSNTPVILRYTSRAHCTAQPNAGTLLAVMGILFYTHTLVFFTNEGFSAAAATRCSNLLGAGAARQVRIVWVVWASRRQMINTCVGLGRLVEVIGVGTRKASED